MFLQKEVCEPRPADARQGPLPAGVQATHVAARAPGGGAHGRRAGLPGAAQPSADPDLQREHRAREASGGHQEPPRQNGPVQRRTQPAPGDKQGSGLPRPAPESGHQEEKEGEAGPPQGERQEAAAGSVRPDQGPVKEAGAQLRDSQQPSEARRS